MKKKNFVPMILGTIGEMLFALEMCMTLVWDVMKQWRRMLLWAAIKGGG